MNSTKTQECQFIDVPNGVKFKHNAQTYHKTSNRTGVSRFSHSKQFKNTDKCTVEIKTK